MGSREMPGARRQLRALAACAVLTVLLNVLLAWALALWAPIPSKYFTGLDAPSPGSFGIGPTSWLHERRCYRGAGYLEAEWRIVQERPTPYSPSSPRFLNMVRTGFPFLAMQGASVSVSERFGPKKPTTPVSVLHFAIETPQWLRPRDRWRLIPLEPIWPGFIFNWLIMTACLYTLVTSTLCLRGALRMRSGRCPRCTYQLGEVMADGCPECGWNRTS